MAAILARSTRGMENLNTGKVNS